MEITKIGVATIFSALCMFTCLIKAMSHASDRNATSALRYMIFTILFELIIIILR